MTCVLRVVLTVFCLGLISVRGIWDISVKILRTKHAKKNIYEILHKYWQYHFCNFNIQVISENRIFAKTRLCSFRTDSLPISCGVAKLVLY